MVLVISLVSLGTLSIYILSLLDKPEFALLFFLFQGLAINFFIIILSYIRVYRYFKAYNISLIEKYKQIYLKEDITKINMSI